MTGAETAAAAGAVKLGKPVAEKLFQGLLKKVEAIDVESNKHFRIDGRGMDINCSEGMQRYEMLFSPKDTGVWPNSVAFPFGVPRRVRIRSMQGLREISEAVIGMDNGFKLNLKTLEPTSQYQLSVEYELENQKAIEALVDRVVPKDAPHKDEEDDIPYEISAMLKYPELLKQSYYGVNIHDFELPVSVSVHEDVKLSVPTDFINELEAIVELSKKKGRDEKWRDLMDLMQAQQSRLGGQGTKLLKSVSGIFTPVNFKKFVDVNGDFKYINSERGSEYFEAVPFPVWPKTMSVVSKTDLNFERPAADGLVLYKRRNLVNEIKGILGENEAK